MNYKNKFVNIYIKIIDNYGQKLVQLRETCKNLRFYATLLGLPTDEVKLFITSPLHT